MITNYFDHWGFQQEGWTGSTDLCRLVIELSGALLGPSAVDARYVLFHSEKFNSKEAETVLSHEGKPVDGFLTGEETELDLLIPVFTEETPVMFVTIGEQLEYLRQEFTLRRGTDQSVSIYGVQERIYVNP